MDFDWKINGNQYQATREGYNLLNNTLQSQTINELKVTVNKDKSVTVVGTATDATSLIFDQSKATLPAGTYIIKDCSTYIESEENHGNWNSGETRTFIAEATLSASGFYKYYASGEVVNVTLYPMLIKGFNSELYEQYGASPSPDYPSEIETVGSNVNYFDKDNVKDEFLVAESGIVLTSTDWKCTDYIEVLKKQYYFSWESESDFFQTRVCFYDKEKTYISGISLETSNTYGQIINIIDNAKYIKISYSINVGGNVISRDKIKLEVGNKRTLYSSYMCGSVEIDVVNDNLFDINSVSYGDLDTATGKKINDVTNIQHSDYIEVFSNENYTINFNNTLTKRVFYLDKNKNVISTNIISTKIANFNTNNNIKYFRVKIIGSFDSETKLEKGLLATSFTEHQSQTAIMPIQQEMLEGDYVAAVEHHEWKKIESYNGETITTDYISTTGQLTTGATVYYKLATPIDLELTEEQKTVRDTKLYTYKNITNIDVNDELASIDVEYKKDQNAVNKNFENRLAALETASTSEEA